VALAGGGLGTLILIVVVMLLGGNPMALLQQAPQPGRAGVVEDPAQEALKQFTATVLADTEDVWNSLFAQIGREYREPTVVLFSGQVRSACGFSSAAVGPFYCPADEKIYLDLSFFQELSDRFGAPGDFAQAYVIAHEVGHHVQNLLGTAERVENLRRGASRDRANELSVRMELQADFLAGVWAHHAQRTKDILERGDIEEAIAAAEAIGDDRLQRQAQGYVTPDSFTHGSSAQRVRWFRRGLTRPVKWRPRCGKVSRNRLDKCTRKVTNYVCCKFCCAAP
jgi:predicted metalloprotease